MGSYNASCFASKQVIGPRAKCYVLPILQARTYTEISMDFDGKTLSQFGIANATCYPNAFWEPFGAFIEGTYDDFGQISLKKSAVNCARLVQFISDLCESAPVVHAGENTSHDHPFNIKEFVADNTTVLQEVLKGDDPDTKQLGALFSDCETVWDHIYYIAQEQRLFASDYNRNVRVLQFAMMHSAAFGNLLTMVSADKLKAHIVEKMLSSLERVEKYKGVDKDLFGFALEGCVSRAVQGIGDFGGNRFPGEEEQAKRILSDYVHDKMTTEDATNALGVVLNDRLIARALSWINLPYSPMVTAGQDYSNDAGKMYADFITQTVDKVSKNRKSKTAAE